MSFLFKDPFFQRGGWGLTQLLENEIPKHEGESFILQVRGYHFVPCKVVLRNLSRLPVFKNLEISHTQIGISGFS